MQETHVIRIPLLWRYQELLNKNLPKLIISLESKKRSEKMYKSFPLLSEPETAKDDSETNNKPINSQPHNQYKAPRINKEALRVLQFWLNSPCIYLTQTDLLLKAGITSGAKGSQIKKIFIQNTYIIEHPVQKAKTYLSIWEPTNKAYIITNAKRQKPRSRGTGYLHDFCSHHIEQYGINNGYKVDVEYFLNNGKPVDQVHRNNDSLIFYEIAISPPLEKEVENVVKNFSTDLVPDKMIIACLNGKAFKSLNNLIKLDSRLDNYRDKIKVVLAGDFIKTKTKG